MGRCKAQWQSKEETDVGEAGWGGLPGISWKRGPSHEDDQCLLHEPENQGIEGRKCP